LHDLAGLGWIRLNYVEILLNYDELWWIRVDLDGIEWIRVDKAGFGWIMFNGGNESGRGMIMRMRLNRVVKDIYILGSEVGTKIKIQSEMRDFNFCSHLGTQYIYIFTLNFNFWGHSGTQYIYICPHTPFRLSFYHSHST
jgi:hypothetical protein